VSYWPGHPRRELQARVLPMVRAVADRWRPQLEEWSVDLGAGRELVIPAGPPRPCAHCWGQRKVFEPGPLGYFAVLCGRCAGSGVDPS
jgi:hypothetical protein